MKFFKVDFAKSMNMTIIMVIVIDLRNDLATEQERMSSHEIRPDS